ncbi:MAG: 3-hydroxyacyl-CoA dehydrogenase/enoyl-CoA hydratase family protein [Flavobacteriaceae bacterium]|nr:3-hydroxyacyl-CoA dehydrogenase/enoyl-CoA hydratase family protein [Flavobacteriaceae bacterium]
MKNRNINKVAVIGSGIMGSGIACHFANIGVEVLLLDIVPRSLNDLEQAKGLTLEDKNVRNRIVNDALAKAIKTNPAPLYHSTFAQRITTGNLEDDIAKVAKVDWIIEVVVERLDIKKSVFEKLDQHRTKGTLISSNTSGIPIAMMSDGRSDDFQAHFCGTHFFNPARYLKLFEIIPGPKTDESVLEFMRSYGEQFLGKTSVVAKDTPAFIGNRIGTYGIQSLFQQVVAMGLSVEDVDRLTGPVIGRPKSATFRTTDLVGLDTLVHVANGVYENCPNDEKREDFRIPDFVQSMMENNWLGDKTGQGFYKKTTDSSGKREILSLDLNTLTYSAQKKTDFPTLAKTKSIENVIDRFPVLVSGDDKASEFYKKMFGATFAYVSNRVPEITEDLYKIDDAMKAGYGWEHGPFQIWDAIGLTQGMDLIADLGLTAAPWVQQMINNGVGSFYSIKNGATYCYDRNSANYQKIPGQDAFIILNNLRENTPVFQNKDFVLHDLGDGILNAEFRSKMNTIGGDVLSGLNKAIDIAEQDFAGLVIGNQGANFSVGANIAMIFMMAVEQEYDELNQAIAYFQNTMMRMRYSSIPTIAAPHGMTLGGGCELSLHADKVVAASETYIGLVEFGVGVIPGGGGSKELTLRASDSFRKNDVELNVLQEYFLTIGMAKVSTSAYEAFDLGILQKGKDTVVVNRDRQIATAKAYAKLMADQGYTKPVARKDIKVLGKQALGMFLVGTDAMKSAHFISEHDHKIANKLAYVMAGGDLSEATLVSEQYLLDIEREAFLSLCGERKTLERIEHMLKTGKPLRN